MSERGKKIFLAICIALPFILYCVYYYSIMVKNAPYKFSEFEHLSFRYGLGDELDNRYDSKTGIYQFVSENDSLIRDTFKLRKDDLLYLHRKAADLGFWNFPEELKGRPVEGRVKNPPTYILEYQYERKSKKVVYQMDYSDNPKLAEAAKSLMKEVSTVISDARDKRQKK